MAQIVDQFQQEYSGKIEHKFTDKVSLTGFYLYNRTDEPCSNYFEPGLNGPNRFADPLDYILKRRPQILAINNTWIPTNNSTLALRFGWTNFPDKPQLSIDFDPATLGFSQNFLSQIAQTPVAKFPLVTFTQGGYRALGAQTPVIDRTYKSIGRQRRLLAVRRIAHLSRLAPTTGRSASTSTTPAARAGTSSSVESSPRRPASPTATRSTATRWRRSCSACRTATSRAPRARSR